MVMPIGFQRGSCPEHDCISTSTIVVLKLRWSSQGMEYLKIAVQVCKDVGVLRSALPYCQLVCANNE